MHYQLYATSDRSTGGWAAELGERRRRYRRNWYREHHARFGEHPVTAAAELRVKSGPGAARWRRILALSAQLGAQIPGELREDWLSFEEALHAHWLAVSAGHYNLGFEAGLRRGLTEAHAPDSADLHAHMRALVDALQRVVSRL